jgi:UDP-glucose 4-epimerase
VYGKGTEKGVIPIWIKAIKNGERLIIYGGWQMRDFIYVDDVCDVIISQVVLNETGMFEVGSGDAIRMDTLCKMLLKMMKSKLKPIIEKPKSGEIEISQAELNNLGLDYARPLEQGLKEMLK